MKRRHFIYYLEIAKDQGSIRFTTLVNKVLLIKDNALAIFFASLISTSILPSFDLDLASKEQTLVESSCTTVNTGLGCKMQPVLEENLLKSPLKQNCHSSHHLVSRGVETTP